jgi:predicted DNA-binding transcriptional regulator YafY
MSEEKAKLNRIRTLLIYNYLEKNSDENHAVSASKLIDMLSEYGITCERKVIYADIEALNKIGCDIMLQKGTGRGYFIASRDFELPEVMLLIDAVTSAGFITPKKTNSLVKKLRSLMSVYQADTMVSQFYVDAQSSKCDNEEIYIVIDHLHDAIMSKQKVKFIYKRRSIDVYNKKKHTEKTFVVSPYALIWKDDHYYLVCNNEKYDNLMNLRIDRMKRLEILDSPARPVSEVSSYENEFDTVDYSSKMFNMFSGDECEVTLQCSLKLQEEMMDRFGTSIPLSAVDTSHFETKVKATLSDGLVSWIMQYGADVKVTSPPQLVDMIKEKVNAIVGVYSE